MTRVECRAKLYPLRGVEWCAGGSVFATTAVRRAHPDRTPALAARPNRAAVRGRCDVVRVGRAAALTLAVVGDYSALTRLVLSESCRRPKGRSGRDTRCGRVQTAPAVRQAPVRQATRIAFVRARSCCSLCARQRGRRRRGLRGRHMGPVAVVAQTARLVAAAGRLAGRRRPLQVVRRGGRPALLVLHVTGIASVGCL